MGTIYALFSLNHHYNFGEQAFEDCKGVIQVFVACRMAAMVNPGTRGGREIFKLAELAVWKQRASKPDLLATLGTLT
jgi:hypothetical protein